MMNKLMIAALAAVLVSGARAERQGPWTKERA